MAFFASQWQAEGAPDTGYNGYMINPATGERMTIAQFNDAKKADADEQERQRVENLRKQGLNPDGSPIAPERESLLDEQGKLQQQYQLNLQQLDPSKLEGYNLIKQLATEQGPSKYAQRAQDLAKYNMQNQLEAGAAQAASAQAQAQNQLAMRGGVSSGSRERMAQQGSRDLLGARQGAYRGFGQSALDIAAQDEAMKRQALSQFGEAEGRIASGNLGLQNQASQYNLKTLLGEKEAANAWKQQKYQAQLDKWASEKQADATAKSGGGGGK